ncbi:hypothetical protein Q31b_23290 [Novipirellula aureliae]|uniref:Uncharacterized protein n=1 Tax=Novipirellula aureliae TaxID=2527966 RepID=A0A5C6E6M2_9BACT|nr:hypothetical protein Q31b_23290 [Novipirellula aureliae]
MRLFYTQRGTHSINVSVASSRSLMAGQTLRLEATDTTELIHPSNNNQTSEDENQNENNDTKQDPLLLSGVTSTE